MQHLGHPIANDLQYDGQYWGPRPPFLIPGTAAAKRLEGEQSWQPQLKRQKVIPIPQAMQVLTITPCTSFLASFLVRISACSLESDGAIQI